MRLTSETGASYELWNTVKISRILFSQRLLAKNIPDVAAIEAVMDAKSPKGKHKIYQFMPLTTLGDGINLKKLLVNLDQSQRDLIIKYVTLKFCRVYR